MSHWTPPQTEAPRQSRDGCVMVGCAVAILGTLTLGAALLVGVWWLYRLIEEERQARFGPLPPLVEPDPERFQAEVAGGFRQELVGVDAQTLRSIERFFRDAARLKGKEAQSAEVRRLIDGQRALAEIEQSPNCVKLLATDRRSLRDAPFSSNPFDQSGTPFRIVHVSLRADGQEAVVWGYFPDPDGDWRPMRWWLVQSGSAWKLFNWEDSDRGRSEVEEIAIMMSLYYRTPRVWNYYSTLATQADAISRNPYAPDARQQLEALDLAALDERVYDDGVMRVAFAWYHVRDYRRCLEVCSLVKKPEIRADVERTRAFCYQQLHRWEEALASAERYEQLIGPTPIVLVSRARVLTELSRPEEAERIWRRVLAVSPANADALAGWAGALPESRCQELIEHLRALPEAQQLAGALVEQLCAADQDAAARAVADWLIHQAPGTRAALQAQADLKNFDEQHAEAGELYLAAYGKAASDDERSALQYSYLSAMAAAGRQVEAHAQAPDKHGVLEAYWWDYTDDGAYELTRKKLLAVVAQHKQTDPHDALAAEVEAHLLSEENRHAEAEQVLTAALKKMKDHPDAEREESLKQALVQTLLDQGKWEQALAQRTKNDDLSTMTWQLINDGHLAEAKALVAQAEKSMPGEPALYLCRVELLLEEGKYAAAWAALPPSGPTGAPQHPLAWRLKHLLSELVVKDESLLPKFAQRVPENDMWDQLATKLKSRGRWETLAKLVELWKSARPSQFEVLDWEAQCKFHASDFAGVAALLAQPLAAPPAEQFNYRRRELHVLLVESLVKLNRLDEARAHGQKVLDQVSDGEPLLAALLAAGDVAGIEQAAAKIESTSSHYSALPYHQPRFAALLRDDRFLPLRQKHPPSLDYGYLAQHVTLLLAEGAPLSAATVQERLAAALPGANVRPLAKSSEAAIQTLEARHGDDRWIVSIGDKPYDSPERLEELTIRDERLREAALAHRRWIEIGRVNGDSPADISAGAIVAVLSPPPGSVIYLESDSRLALWDEALAKRLSAAADDEDFKDVGESAYLFSDDEAQPLRRRQWREFTRKYRQRATDSPPFRVQVELTLGAAREPLWFAVSRLETSQWTSTLVGTAEADSLLYPSLKKGEPRQIDAHRVLAVDPASEMAAAP